MDLEEISSLIATTKWFSRLGDVDVDPSFVRIPNLKPWATDETQDAVFEKIADEMEWLPSSREEVDPVHKGALQKRAEAVGKRQEISAQALEAYKKTLAALRTSPEAALRIGPHDFTGAARGAALYAVYQAAYEVALEQPDFWCRILKVYQSGHWPCGLLPDGRIVVL